MTSPLLPHATILLTGAGSVLGRAFAEPLLAAGASTLVLVDRGAPRELETLAGELEARRPGRAVRALSCDLGHPGDVATLLRRVDVELPLLDVWVHVAAEPPARSRLGEGGWEPSERLLQANVRALARLSHAWIPGMIARGRGGVLWVGSAAATLPWGAAPVWAASQRFLDGLAESLRVELAGTGVNLTEVLPGPVTHDALWEAGLSSSRERPVLHRWVVSPEQVVAEALDGFARRRARVVPGFALRQALRLVSLLPHPLRRAAFELDGLRRRRAREKQAGALGPTRVRPLLLH